ncbi:MAG TPA: transcription elongation factor GreA [Candidatus Saccharimonadales bacterium]|nr:transcription elongation factor GreA [Candidatus Saccharimonadales bacterium]
MKKEILMTAEGLEKLKTELKELTETRRPEVVNRIKEAKALGDLSENAEYSSAKEDQSFIEGRIEELEQQIKQAKVVNGAHKGTVGIGSEITVEIEGDKDNYKIVGPTESDPAKGRISIDSPVGQAVLGHKAGDKVKVQTPDGAVDYKIISVK